MRRNFETQNEQIMIECEPCTETVVNWVCTYNTNNFVWRKKQLLKVDLALWYLCGKPWSIDHAIGTKLPASIYSLHSFRLLLSNIAAKRTPTTPFISLLQSRDYWKKDFYDFKKKERRNNLWRLLYIKLPMAIGWDAFFFKYVPILLGFYTSVLAVDELSWDQSKLLGFYTAVADSGFIKGGGT